MVFEIILCKLSIICMMAKHFSEFGIFVWINQEKLSNNIDYD